jgi:hypothetical protein
MPLPLRIIPEIITGSLTTEFSSFRHSVGAFHVRNFPCVCGIITIAHCISCSMASEDATFFQRAAIPAFETALGKNAMGGK